MAKLITTASPRLFQVRRLLAIVSTLGLTLAATPLTYAQDVPTPTPPADGGEFEGAPEPTPGVEITPEPDVTEPDVIDPEATSPDTTEPGITTPTPAEQLPNNNTIPESFEQTEEASEEPATPELQEDVVPGSPTGESVETPATNENTPAGGEPGANIPQTDEDPATGSTAPANNSPRGLW